MNVRKSVNPKRMSRPLPQPNLHTTPRPQSVLSDHNTIRTSSDRFQRRFSTMRSRSSDPDNSTLPSLMADSRERYSSGYVYELTASHTPKLLRSPTKLFTGSTYRGSWNQFGFNGLGTYRFPNGVEYDGYLNNGHFHGIGTLMYPNGTVITGEWRRGISTHKSLQFQDGLAFNEKNWSYCGKLDKRFSTTEFRDMAPVGKHKLMPKHMDYPIPPGYYNTGEGFYDPRTKCLYSFKDPTQIVRIPTSSEEKWILANCPTGWNELSTTDDKQLLENTNYKAKDEDFSISWRANAAFRGFNVLTQVIHTLRLVLVWGWMMNVCSRRRWKVVTKVRFWLNPLLLRRIQVNGGLTIYVLVYKYNLIGL